MNEYALAALVGIVMALIELVKGMVRRFQGGRSGLSEREHEMLVALFEWHDCKDTDGTPMWYVPRSWSSAQEKLVEAMREITHTQRMIAATLERIEARLQDHTIQERR